MDEPTDDEQLEELLDYVKDNRGFDFTGYKRSSLRRRILRRMETVHCADFETYQRYLADREEEFGELFNTILINVTSFFRDADAWSAVAEKAIPDILLGPRISGPGPDLGAGVGLRRRGVHHRDPLLRSHG